MLAMFLKGFGIGFSIAAIVGPIALLCIRSTLSEGQAVGLAIGLGASLADAIYGIVAAFGLTYLSQPLLKYRVLLHILGGIFLLYLGFRTFYSKPSLEEPAHLKNKKHLINYTIGTLFLTLTNPITIIYFMAVFASLGVANSKSSLPAILMVFGIFLGCMVWWIILTSFLRLFHGKMTQKQLIFINRFSGILIIFFGIAAIASILIKK